ncbi:WavE lipopolysaccharide synthesis family protein [Motilimonas sp. KMU-193]|uniref:WavE lipopolysaccharide synthesis family protein n=1 Tax=Motilimonas sp. KMU-193 TaxID=3388668 RepID=UPI00396B08DD
MNFADITVVVQGPVQVYDNRHIDENITSDCLASVRQHLPGAKIILSTWHNQDLSGLDYDELILNEDPGPNLRHFTKNKKPRILNNNRQIATSRNGLKAVTTKYAVKLRTDNILTSNKFVELQARYNTRNEPDSLFVERVVITNTFTRKYAKGLPVAYHFSDFFYFGLTTDLIKIWDLAYLPDYDIDQEKFPNKHYPYYPIDCTQLFWMYAIQNFDKNFNINHLHDITANKLVQSERFIASNLVIASPEEIGLGLCKKFLGKARANRASGRYSYYQFNEWKSLYNRYCGMHEPVDKWQTLKLAMMRWLLIRPVALQTSYKLIKRLIRGCR